MRFGARTLLVILSILLCCKTEKTPPGVLTRQQMADWMMDIYLAEARTMSLNVSRDSAYKLFVPYQDSLMKEKGIQDSTIKISYKYYLEHPSELESIYDIVIDSLSLLEQQTRPTPGNP